MLRDGITAIIDGAKAESGNRQTRDAIAVLCRVHLLETSKTIAVSVTSDGERVLRQAGAPRDFSP